MMILLIEMKKDKKLNRQSGAAMLFARRPTCVCRAGAGVRAERVSRLHEREGSRDERAASSLVGRRVV